jgi:hypothetical protein
MSANWITDARMSQLPLKIQVFNVACGMGQQQRSRSVPGL